MIILDQEKKETTPVASIKVIGIGGAGGNTINNIIDSGYQGIEFIAANTDAQALELSKAQHKIRLGIKSTKGLGTGANPDLGKRAAEEDIDKLLEVIEGADIVFLTAGLGGGTGSGATPIIAQALKEQGILSIAIVTKPFLFEGKKRGTIAHKALEELKKVVDTLIVIPNQKLLEVVDQTVSMIDAFSMINDVLGQSVKGISDIIARPGHINVDFADVKTIMQDRGLAVMGTAKNAGPNRAKDAALEAISSPLLENMSIQGARGVLLNITGGKNLGLHEISQAAQIIYEQADEDAHIIIGSVIDESMQDEVSVTVIATGFELPANKEEVKVKATIIDKAEMQKTKKEIAESEKQSTQEIKNMPEEENKKIQPKILATDILEKKLEFQQPGKLLIDLENLDVPTFLRQKYADGKEEENNR